MRPIAEELAAFIHDLDFDRVPAEVIEKAKWCLLDWIGCAVAGLDNKGAGILVDFALSQNSGGESTVVGHRGGFSPLWAGFANGALSHAAEMDDGHKKAIMHGAVVTIPAAAALTQDRHLSGRELLLSIIAGYEVALRTGEATGKSHYAFWHTTATAGTFGAAAASARAMGLDAEKIADALGTAGTQASGLWQFLDDKAMSKVLHTAKASLNGMLAAYLADKGFTGPHRIFEGEKGFVAATSKSPNIDALTKGLGESYKIMESNFKVHSSCGHTHSPIDALFKITGQYKISPEDVRSIRLSTYTEALGLIANPNPATPFEAMFSAPFCLATALVSGKVDFESLGPEALANPVIRELANKVEIVVDPEYDRRFPSCRPTKVEVFLNNGTSVAQENFFRKGDPENPLAREDLVAKFQNLAGNRLGPEKTEAIVKATFSIEDASDAGLLFRMLEM